LESADLNDAWLKMTTAPQMRELAHRLLAYEAGAGQTSEPTESPTLRVYEKLRLGLGNFAGVAGFQSLASRALALSRAESPSFCSARVSADGVLQCVKQGLDELDCPIDHDKDQVAERVADEEGILLISHLLDLLHLFLGEALTLSLLRVTWPGAALDDCNSENGRIA
jgi:hypothetical protein